MAYERFLDRNVQPDQAMISTQIGDMVLSVWNDVTDLLKRDFPGCQSKMIYYSRQHGWGIRYRHEATLLCTLFPERGAFTALVTLDPQEETAALEKVNFFNARIREILNQFSTLPQGRWLWIRIEDHTDFVGLKLLLDLKKH